MLAGDSGSRLGYATAAGEQGMAGQSNSNGDDNGDVISSHDTGKLGWQGAYVL